MTNEEIIEKIRTTLAEEFEVDIDVIQAGCAVNGNS